ncbi:MAG: BMC domain-containing protein [Defluviitaleaceae bacterium]|nr:BMC domain-containing protein [Defluviitaleaceae bacterium]
MEKKERTVKSAGKSAAAAADLPENAPNSHVERGFAGNSGGPGRGSVGGSVGIIELPNLADAISVLDVMLKSAGVRFVTWEKRLGGRLVTIIVSGGAADVKEAVDAARQCPGVRIAAWAVIPNPHAETWKMINRSAQGVK